MRSISTWSVFVAFAGLLVGFDMAVISGAEQGLLAQWQGSTLAHGFLMSAALWGMVVGALGASLPCDKLGRHSALLLVGAVYGLAALGAALAREADFFGLVRFFGGLAMGVATVAIPGYITEISRAGSRGRLVALFPLQLALGFLLGYVGHHVLAQAVEGASWRWMFACEVPLALIFLLLVRKAPESPRWSLLYNRNGLLARKVLEELQYEDVDEELRCIVLEQGEKQYADKLFAGNYGANIMLATVLAIFNQMSGIIFVILFAPRLLGAAGFDEGAALLYTGGLAVVNAGFTLLGLALIDGLGRKVLLMLGSLGAMIGLSTVAWAFSTGPEATPVLAGLLLFIAAHAMGQGSVIWVFLAEIFPNRVRAKGQSLASGTLWLLAALVSMGMLWLLESFELWQIFAFFAAMMLLQLLFVLLLLPETKGRRLEEISTDA